MANPQVAAQAVKAQIIEAGQFKPDIVSNQASYFFNRMARPDITKACLGILDEGGIVAEGFVNDGEFGPKAKASIKLIWEQAQ